MHAQTGVHFLVELPPSLALEDIMGKNLEEFIEAYLPDGEGAILDITPKTEAEGWAHIVVRHPNGRFVAVLHLMALGGDRPHLCIDVHPFVDGEDATVAAVGMTTGARFAFEAKDTGTTSLRWPSANMVAAIIGEQATS